MSASTAIVPYVYLPYIYIHSQITRSVKYFLLLLCVSTFITHTKGDCSVFDATVSIKPQQYAYFVDGHWSDKLVKIVPSYSGDDQSWMIQPSARIGLFNLVNVGNGEALDLSSTYDSENDSFNATTNILVDNISQQWFINGDGTFSNAGAANHVLDVQDGNYTSSNYLVVRNRTETTAKFIINVIN